MDIKIHDRSFPLPLCSRGRDCWGWKLFPGSGYAVDIACVNSDGRSTALTKDGVPDWLEPAMARLDRYERNERPENATAYVWITNADFHRRLRGPPSFAA